MSKVFTTGQIARICQVAHRTVTKWCDAGKLRHYRIPTSQDRRVYKEDLREFLRANGMRVPPEVDDRRTVLCVGLGDPALTAVEAAVDGNGPVDRVSAFSLFAAGAEYEKRSPAVVVVCLSVGRVEAGVIGRRVMQDGRQAVLIAGEDVTDTAGLREDGYSVILRQPFPPDDLTTAVVTALED